MRLQRVFVDANVLVSRTTRDWLFLLRNETQGMFQVHSTFDVIVEAVRAFRRLHPRADGSESKRLFDLLEQNLDELLGDFDGDVDFAGGDPGDLHVHAAAVASDAHVLLNAEREGLRGPRRSSLRGVHA